MIFAISTPGQAGTLADHGPKERSSLLSKAENPRRGAWGSKLPRIGISDAAAGCRGDGDHRVAVNDYQSIVKSPNLHCTFGRTRYLHDMSFDTFV